MPGNTGPEQSLFRPRAKPVQTMPNLDLCGSFDSPSHRLAQPHDLAHPHGIARAGRFDTEIVSGENGAQGRDRTTDTAIFSRMLYQLSYLGMLRLRAARRGL